MGLFYMCNAEKCNSKYKTKKKLIEHALLKHQTIVTENEIAEPVEVTQETKVVEGKKKDERVKHQEALKKAQAEALVKKEFERENGERIKKLEEEKLLEEKYFLIVNKILHRPNNSTECAICSDSPANAIVLPCGHAVFCMNCIFNYKENYNHRGCPCCRGPMKEIHPLFQ